MDERSCTVLAFVYAAIAIVGLSPSPARAATFDPATRVRVEADQTFARLGISVASAGNVNGDDYDDVIVGAWFYDAGESNEGAAFLFLGGPSGIDAASLADAATQLESDQVDARFGSTVAGAGDVNGDGFDDILLGAEWYTETQFKEGAAFLYLGGEFGIQSGDPSTANAKLYGNQANAELGAHVAAAGDVNSDGYDDIVLGVPFYDAPLVDEGAALLYLGSASGIQSGGPSVASAILEGDQAGAQFGASAASAGDANGDGFGDLLVGASRYDAGNADEGVALPFLGSASGIANAGATDAYQRLEENQQGSYFGSTAAPAGDVNGDGYDDALVGTAFWRNPDDGEGAFFVYLGGAPAACRNGLDDDGDSAIDGGDFDCTSPTDAFEEFQLADGASHAITAAVDDDVLALDGSGATITSIEIVLGGSVSGDLRAFEHSLVRVAGGFVAGNVLARDDAEAEIASGSVLGQVRASGAAHVTIRGGNVAGIVARDTSRVDLVGTGFNLPLGDVGELSGTLTGALADGTELAASFERDAGATIHLAPEPGAFALALCSGLALGAVARRRRACLQPGRAVRYPSNP